MLRLPTIVAAVTGLLALAGPSAGQDWTAAADMPGSGRHHPVNFTLDGYGYVVTGSSGGNTADFFRYVSQQYPQGMVDVFGENGQPGRNV